MKTEGNADVFGYRHSGESRNPVPSTTWTPAFAGVTNTLEVTELIERIKQAITNRTPLCIRGGGSKTFYGRAGVGETLNVSGHRGIIAYEPTELVITARAGTPLAEIEAVLAANQQMLPFEPPHFTETSTLGGMVAAGLSGPRRPWGGSVRDAVLGVKLLNGRGEVLRLGGQVMKNVAGYDVSRLMVGALGTLGVLLEVSLKVLPRPASERTLLFQPGEAAIRAAQLPISASLEVDGKRYLRLSASARCVEQAIAQMGGDQTDASIWAAVRDQTHPFFATDLPLWRISLPAAAPALNLPGSELIEWNGALRWLISDLPGKTLRQRVVTLGGHATLFKGHDGGGKVFQPLPPAMLALHQRVKLALDPQRIFNPGRLYPEL
jgi:glycolate oxidase FAD binding subunit